MDRLEIQFVDGGGYVKAAAYVEFAETPESRRVGLSRRSDLADTGGMLFDKAGVYWMKDVNFSLDLLFLDKQGEILEHHHMPIDREGIKLYAPMTLKAAHALELPGGWFAKHGLKAGDRIVVTDVDKG